MRTIIIIVLAILIAAGAYTAFGVLNFDPEQPAPLVFKEPDPATLKALGIYGEVQTKDITKSMTAEQQAQSKAAVEKIADAIVTYQEYEQKATQRLKTTLSVLNGYMSSGQLPAYFLNVTDALHPERQFDLLQFDPTLALAVKEPQTSIACTPKTDVLIGDNGKNTLSCDLTEVGGSDKIFLGGPGDDTINDSFGNRIVNGGSGNDTIKLGPGRSIIVLEDGWGKDDVTVDCRGVPIAFTEIPTSFPVPWVSKFTNFIVLSPRIQTNAIKWQGNTLTNTASGDSLTVNENCFTLIGIQ